MKLAIFPRMLIGFGALFALVVSLLVHSFLQFRHFNNALHHAVEIESRIMDYDKRLADSLLAAMRYERKYTQLKDRAFFDQFEVAKRDFSDNLSNISAIADTAAKKDVVRKIKDNYDHYGKLVNDEAGYVEAKIPYDRETYKQGKDEAVNSMLEGLELLKSDSLREAAEKMRKLEEEGSNTLTLSVILAIEALIVGVLISFFMTKGITRPLSLLIDKTGQIAGGDLKADLEIKSPPEIAELAKAINIMCDQLRKVDKMKSDFFSTMSHELRTPLTSIKEGTSLMLDGVAGEASDKQRRLLSIVAEESDRLINLVNSFLDLSKMEAGMMPYNFTDTQIGPLLRQVVTEVEPLAMSKGIQLQVICPSDLPQAWIDTERILQALRNLVSNAVKFTPEKGQVIVAAEVSDGSLKISVKDTGIGISAEHLATIFDKFRQGEPMGQAKGSGIGLAIVKQVITAHGGTVWVESEPGQGSAFAFVLPL